jgi:hypothetical protein
MPLVRAVEAPRASAEVTIAAMHLRLFDPAALPELRQHFTRSGFSVAEDGERLIVGRPEAPDARQERREIELHLQVWQAMHPEVGVELTT